MDVMLLRLFQRQVLFQCHCVLFAAQDYNSSQEEIANIGMAIDRSWFAIQNLLNAAANISKACWGQGGRFATQRKVLRDSIGLSDSSPLRRVTLRNKFEHIDEYLDTWWAESTSHNYFDKITGGPIAGGADRDKFRIFDPQSGELTLWSEHFNLKEIIEEVQRILPRVAEEAIKPHWGPQDPDR